MDLESQVPGPRFWFPGPGSWIPSPSSWAAGPGSFVPVHSVIVTNCDKNLLQNVTGITKCDKKLLQSVPGIKNCDNYDKVRCNICQMPLTKLGMQY